MNNHTKHRDAELHTNGAGSGALVDDLLIDTTDLAYVARRYFWLLVALPVACVAVAMVAYLMKQPMYKSSGLIYVDPSFDRVLQTEIVESRLRDDLDSLKSLEVAMTGDSMVLRVIDRLNLRESEGFLPKKMAERNPAVSDAELVDYLQEKRFHATLVEETRLLNIEVFDPNPERAKTIAVAFCAEFESFLIGQRQAEAHSRRAAKETQLAASREIALAAERQLGVFREAHPEFPVEQDHDMFSQRVSQFSDELNAVVRERIELESQNSELMEIDPESSPVSVIEVADYQRIQYVSDVLSQQAAADIRLAAAKKKWTPADPKYSAAVAEFDRNEEQLRRLAVDIRQAITSKLSSVKKREDALRRELDGLKGGLVDMKALSSEFRALQHQVEREWSIHETLQTRLSENILAEEESGNVATVVSEPMVNAVKARPQALIYGLLGSGLGGFAAISWIVFCILRGLPYSSRNQLESRLGLQVIADWSEGRESNGGSRDAMLQQALGSIVQVAAPALNGVGESVASSLALLKGGENERTLLIVIAPGAGTRHHNESQCCVVDGDVTRIDISAQAALRPTGIPEILQQAHDRFSRIVVEAGACDNRAVVEWLTEITDQTVVVVGKGDVRKQVVNDFVDHLGRGERSRLSLMMIDPRTYPHNSADSAGVGGACSTS